jgi:hypothetical protein
MTLFDQPEAPEAPQPNANARFIVNKLLLWLILVPLLVVLAIVLLGGIAHGQTQGSCLIVKHKGTLGRRLMWTALIGVPIAPGAKYDYVDSIRFANAKMSYGGNELREIESSGTHVVVIDKFRADALAAARQSCPVLAPESPKPTAPALAPSKAPPAEPEEHKVEGYTMSESGADVATPSGGTSLGEAARQAKVKKQQQTPPEHRR